MSFAHVARPRIRLPLFHLHHAICAARVSLLLMLVKTKSLDDDLITIDFIAYSLLLSHCSHRDSNLSCHILTRSTFISVSSAFVVALFCCFDALLQFTFIYLWINVLKYASVLYNACHCKFANLDELHKHLVRNRTDRESILSMKCCQGDCWSSFNHFFNLLCHLRTYHSSEVWFGLLPS